MSLPPSRTASIHNFFSQPDPLPDRDLPAEHKEALAILDSALDNEDEDDDEADEEEEEDRSGMVRKKAIGGGETK